MSVRLVSIPSTSIDSALASSNIFPLTPKRRCPRHSPRFQYPSVFLQILDKVPVGLDKRARTKPEDLCKLGKGVTFSFLTVLVVVASVIPLLGAPYCTVSMVKTAEKVIYEGYGLAHMRVPYQAVS